MATADTSVLHRDRHIKYWLRCLRSPLPTGYTSNDSNRMTLAFFTISALDVLDILHTHTNASERDEWIDWIYRCQLARGGFRGFTGADFGARGSVENEAWDPANLAATFFALATLVVLGDGLERVRRVECLEWLRRLQWKDGSFGELLGDGGKIEGTRDMRYCYMAAGVRWILRGGVEGAKAADIAGKDIDVETLVRFINSSEVCRSTPVAGMTYCGISALSFLDRLPKPPADAGSKAQELGGTGDEPPPVLLTGLPSLEGTVHWLVGRQTAYFPDDEIQEEEEGDGELESATSSQEQSSDLEQERMAAKMASESFPHEIPYAGFGGRCNKSSDTCYSFWVGGALAILDRVNLIDTSANRRFLLECTQHSVLGGFGKLPGDIPGLSASTDLSSMLFFLNSV
ncbi:hypothetical protein GP486_000902 [Trichoglossum hirsutum]|uniref:Prenyltransferase alpha-alpha toroid domain-containing protein n=1 Tax=Trichoglossum hirsutum TaxID=265104 RepID=A0A9P8RT46_9PEZI|nr:hypothetical protein GP486_000902 [Trichoglossum hirsutum]